MPDDTKRQRVSTDKSRLQKERALMNLPTDHPVTIRFADGKEMAVTVQDSDALGVVATSAEGQARTIVIPWSAINQVTWQ
jgi:hypothetical protein